MFSHLRSLSFSGVQYIKTFRGKTDILDVAIFKYSLHDFRERYYTENIN